MVVFVDTSAFYALMAKDDANYPRALAQWSAWQESGDVPTLHTSNYVLLETTALVQNRLGMDAIRAFQSDVVPVIVTHWISRNLHSEGMAALLAADRRQLSLVDCTSFVVMRHLGIENAFAFDQHFAEQGFRLFPL